MLNHLDRVKVVLPGAIVGGAKECLRNTVKL
jgi:hypothetical protein